jgi:hypothetical protein
MKVTLIDATTACFLLICWHNLSNTNMAEAQACGVEASSAPLMWLWCKAHEQCAACVKLRFIYKPKQHGGRPCEKLFILESDHSRRAVNMKFLIGVYRLFLRWGKMKFFLWTPWRNTDGWRWGSTLSYRWDRSRCVVWSYWGSGAVSSEERAPCTLWVGGWVGPRAGVDPWQ